MFNSLRSRLLLVMVLLILGTTSTVLYFVSSNVEKSLTLLLEQEAKQLIKSVSMNVELEYKSIVFHKETALHTRKQELKNLINLAFSSTNTFYSLYQKGILSEKEAKQQAMNSIRSMRFNDGVGYIWINNTKLPMPQLVMHPILPNLEGKNLEAPKYYCALGKNEHLLRAFVNVCKQHGAGYVDYLWPKPLPAGITEDRPKISYVKLFKPWNWIIGTGVYIDDIDAAARQRLTAVKKELKDILSRITIAQSGYMFIFDGTSKVIIHPTLEQHYFNQIKNIETGNSFYTDLIDSLTQTNGRLDYHWNKPPTDLNNFTYPKRCYISYFKPLDWYICSSIYTDEITQPIRDIKQNILVISIVFFVIAALISILLSKNLVSPIQRLATTAELIEKEGIKSVEVPVCGTAETKELGVVLSSMLTSLKEREQQLNGIAHNLPGIIYQLKRNQEDKIEFNYMSEKAISIFEISKDHLFSFDDFYQKIIKKDQQHFLTSLKTAFSQKKQWFFEGRYTKANGQILWIQGRGTPIEYNGDIVINGILLDITEQKQTEMQLLQSRKMDSIGQLAGGIAHDFNNMLGGIIGFSDLLMKKLEPDSKLTVFVKGILSAAENAADLTSKLLAFSRQAKNLSTPINVHESISGALQLLERSINKKISIISDLKAEASIIIGDPAQLQNIFLNLGLNARDAMKDEGTLSIVTSNIELDEMFCNNCQFKIQPGLYIQINVEDTGSGIPKSLQEKIFDPFFTTKEVGEGTGLGLAAVYGTVKDHHGAILLYSEEEQGTAFNIYFPVDTTAAEQVERKLHDAEQDLLFHGSGTILIIDDEEIVRTMAEHLFKELGYEVILATNGEEGIEQFKKFRDKIDLIILDMIMPKMDGKECYYAIRKICPDIDVIISSGFTKNKSVSDLIKDGVKGFIKKPYKRSDVCRILSSVLTRKN